MYVRSVDPKGPAKRPSIKLNIDGSQELCPMITTYPPPITTLSTKHSTALSTQHSTLTAHLARGHSRSDKLCVALRKDIVPYIRIEVRRIGQTARLVLD